MPTTLARMGRKKSAKNKPKTALIRVTEILAKKLGVISQVNGKDIADIVSPILSAQVDKLYAEAVATLGRDIGKE